MPDGVVIVPDYGNAVQLTASGARRLTDRIRGHLESAIVGLAAARDGGAHLVLGYPSWWAYVEAEFGDLRELRLPIAERRALVESMRDDALSVRAIAGKLGVSVGTVHGDLPGTLERAKVVALREPEVSPYAGLSRAAETLARVAAQDARGLTSIELDAETGWPMGTATSRLSEHAARGRLLLTDARRRNRGAYVITETGRAWLAARTQEGTP